MIYHPSLIEYTARGTAVVDIDLCDPNTLVWLGVMDLIDIPHGYVHIGFIEVHRYNIHLGQARRAMPKENWKPTRIIRVYKGGRDELCILVTYADKLR